MKRCFRRLKPRADIGLRSLRGVQRGAVLWRRLPALPLRGRAARLRAPAHVPHPPRGGHFQHPTPLAGHLSWLASGSRPSTVDASEATTSMCTTSW